MINCVWYKTDGKWAAAFPKFILDCAANSNIHHQVCIPNGTTIDIRDKGLLVICVPGENVDEEEAARMNLLASWFDKVVWVIFGDERGLFNPDWLNHPNQIVWSFAPQFPIRQGVDRVAPFGWTTRQEWPLTHKYIDWCFMGQDRHQRRHQCVRVASSIPNGLLLRTDGFAKGLPPQYYFWILASAKFALCPGGPCTADSFRFAEALECGTIPIVEHFPGEWQWPPGYWNAVCGRNLPFPVIHDWDMFPDIFEEWNKDYELKLGNCVRWWMAMKLAWADRMREDLQ